MQAPRERGVPSTGGVRHPREVKISVRIALVIVALGVVGGDGAGAAFIDDAGEAWFGADKVSRCSSLQGLLAQGLDLLFG